MRNNEKSHFVWKQRRSEDEECAGWGEHMHTWHGDDNLYNIGNRIYKIDWE